jgi:hypothetical protein
VQRIQDRNQIATGFVETQLHGALFNFPGQLSDDVVGLLIVIDCRIPACCEKWPFINGSAYRQFNRNVVVLGILYALQTQEN